MENKVSFYQPSQLNTAVLFLVFNRLETTKQVFESIRKAQPSRLYLAADGARTVKDGEDEKVLAVRNYILDNIDWPCEVKTLFRDENLGCKYAVSSAITWFFENEEQGIILEDDCLPSQSFFWFCEELLDKYKNDMRIWHISGDNFQNGILRGPESYYFSMFNHIWGWASWANRWNKYDVEMKNYEAFKSQNILAKILNETVELKYWANIFQDVSDGKIDTWDYQWTYIVWCNNGLSVIPNTNLISNIGFGQDATHTKNLESEHSMIPRSEISFPLKHPIFLIKDHKADKYTFSEAIYNKSLFSKVKRKIKTVLKK